MNTGYGYDDIVKERKNAGCKRIEDPGETEHTVYIGRTHVTDFESGMIARSLLKIGKATYMNNVQRGRNQAGGDFRVYARIIFPTKKDAADVEKWIKRVYKNRSATGTYENQTELYDFNDDEISGLVQEIQDYLDRAGFEYTEVKIYI